MAWYKTPRSLDMLYLCIDDRLTLDEISKLYDISRERVRQLITRYPEYKTFRKLRGVLNKQYNALYKSLKPYRDNEKVTKNFWSRVDKSNDCWEWTGNINPVTRYGRYNNVLLERAYGEGASAHRQAWCIASGRKVPDGKFICHTCDNPSCVNPKHLYLGDAQSNVNDREERSNRKAFTRKLSDKNVINIREIYKKEGISCLENLASAYDVTETYLYILVLDDSKRMQI